MTTVDRFDDNGTFLTEFMRENGITTSLFLPPKYKEVAPQDYAVILGGRGPKLPVFTPDEALASAAYFRAFHGNLDLTAFEVEAVREKIAKRLCDFGATPEKARAATMPLHRKSVAKKAKQKSASADSVADGFSRLTRKEKLAFMVVAASSGLAVPDQITKEAMLSGVLPPVTADYSRALLQRMHMLNLSKADPDVTRLESKLARQGYPEQAKTLLTWDFEHGLAGRYGAALAMPEDALQLPKIEKRAEVQVRVGNASLPLRQVVSKIAASKTELQAVGLSGSVIDALSGRFGQVYPTLPVPIKAAVDNILLGG